MARAEHDGPSKAVRLTISCLVAILMAWRAHWHLVHDGPRMQAADFTYPLLAARALVQNVDAYSFVLASRTPWEGPLFYPITAAIVAMPFAWIPDRLAGELFVGLSCGLLAFAVTRRALWPLLMFASVQARAVASSGQGWAPLLMAAALLYGPAVGLVAAKPNLALALVGFQSSWRPMPRAAIVGCAIVFISLALQPGWPLRWFETLQLPDAVQYVVPLFQPIGVVIALAAIKWRRPEARLLLGLALAPQNGYGYDQFPLVLVPASRVEMLIVLTAGWIGAFVMPFARDARMPYVIAALYIPALFMVLRRANVAASPTEGNDDPNDRTAPSLTAPRA